MQLDRSLWFVRWYIWSRRVTRRFFFRGYRYDPGEIIYTTNLCDFLRTIVLGTLAAILTLGLYVYILFTVLILPFLIFRVISIGFAIAVILGAIMAICAIIAFVFGICYLGDRVSLYYRNKTEPTFLSLVAIYYHATKQRICPIITFQDKANHADAD